MGKQRSSPEILMAADPTLFSRMLSNLIRNAYRYGKEGGWIRVILKKTETGILLSVEDNGIGMAEEELPKIWNRFLPGGSHPGRLPAEVLVWGFPWFVRLWRFTAEGSGVESREGEGSKFIVFFKN